MSFATGETQLLVNFIVLTPVIFAIRFLFPTVNALQWTFIVAGALLLSYYAPRCLLFYIALWLMVWALQYAMHWAFNKTSGWKVTVITVLSLCLPLAPMMIWKFYPDWFIQETNIQLSNFIWRYLPILGPVDSLADFMIPLGLSFTTFRALDLLIKLRIGAITAPLTPKNLLFYGFFPPVLAMGPIIEYNEITMKQDTLPRFSTPADIAVGLSRIAIGCIKVFGIAMLLIGSTSIFASYKHLSLPSLWLGLFLFAWFFYFNFSGYSDIAIGAARLHGFRLKENFNNPFFQKSPQHFWANWHMSLTRFTQRNIFMPLGGIRPNKQYMALFATMMFIALWHSPTISLVIFGAYHGLVMVGERYIQNLRKQQTKIAPETVSVWQNIGNCVGTFAYVLMGFPLLMLQPDELMPFYRCLFGLSV